jgi:hypothetical protein
MSKDERKYPKGFWMATGISIGIVIGMAMGPIFESTGIGIAIGIAIGSGIGASLERRNRDKIRPLTENELKRQKVVFVVALVLISLLLLALIAGIIVNR